MTAPAPSPREPVKRSRRIPPLLGFAGGVLVGAACFVAVIMIWGWSPMPAEIEPTVVTALMDYAKAQTADRKKDWNGDGKHTYAKTLKELSDAGLIPEEMAEASGPNGKPYRGYLYLECRTIGEVPINWADDFAICAIPARYGKDGYRTFIVSTNGTVFPMDQGPKGTFVRDYPGNPTAAGWVMDCDERPSRP